MIFLIGFRESDYTVSKLYYIPWPIYSDYVYPAGVEKISFLSLDGTQLTGWYFHGKSPLAQTRPVLLYLHGNAGNLAAQYGQFEFLPEWGYDVFAVDYRGYGSSRGHPSREGLWKDAQAAFQEMAVLQPGRKYGVVGFSMGAAYAMMLVGHEPRVSAAAIIAPFTTFREIGIDDLKKIGFPNWLAPIIGWVLVPDGLEPRDAEQSKQLPPALFVHGTADGSVPYWMGEQMAGLYSAPVSFLTMPGYNHGDFHLGPMGNTFHKAFDKLFTKGGNL
ncbi:MAG TPA: alpha/beta fold hydrolase [bacterium]